jgi:hypothetical protein
VNAKFVCGLLPTSNYCAINYINIAKQVAHESQYTVNQNALKVQDMWDATAQEFFDLTAITQKIMRRIKCTVDKSSVGVTSTVKVKVK